MHMQLSGYSVKIHKMHVLLRVSSSNCHETQVAKFLILRFDNRIFLTGSHRNSFDKDRLANAQLKSLVRWRDLKERSGELS